MESGTFRSELFLSPNSLFLPSLLFENALFLLILQIFAIHPLGFFANSVMPLLAASMRSLWRTSELRSSLRMSEMTDLCGLDHRRLRLCAGDESAMFTFVV